DANNMQTLSKTVLQSTMAPLINNVSGSADFEYLNVLDQSANILKASREMQRQERVLTDMQKEIAAKGQQSSANTLPNMPHHDVKDNGLTQKNGATVQEPQNIPLIHEETAESKRTYYKRVSEAKSTLENFETTMQKAQKALGIINKIPNPTAQTDKLQDKSQDETKSVQSAQLIMNRAQAQGDASLQMPLKAQKPIMRKEQSLPQEQTSQSLAKTQAGQNSAQAQPIQSLAQTQASQSLAKAITAQNQKLTATNNAARNTALMSKLFTYADFLRNKAQKPIGIKPQTMEMRKEQSLPQAQAAQSGIITQNKNTAQNSAITQNKNTAQNDTITQNKPTAQNSAITQNAALENRVFTSAEVLHNKAQKQMQEKADKAPLPSVQTAKQREPVTTVNTAASQLVYPMANMAVPTATAVRASESPAGIFANTQGSISRYSAQRGENFMQNAVIPRQSEAPSMQHRALTRQQILKAQGEAQANAQQALPLEYSLSPIYGEPQAKSHLPQDLSKVYSRSEAPVARVFPKEKNNAPKENTPQDDAMDIPTVHKKSAETHKTTTDIQKQNIEINNSQPIQSVKSADTTMELQEAEVMRITDKVYHAIESRLRSEKMRRGMW
ncbi:MAG: hypothetical protein RR271_01955, partial [Oscillospiraceae bacterium]